MSEQATFNKVREMIVERFGVPEETITESMTFDELGADSLDVVELVMEIEDAYGIEFDDDRIEQLNNISDAVNYIDELKA